MTRKITTAIRRAGIPVVITILLVSCGATSGRPITSPASPTVQNTPISPATPSPGRTSTPAADVLTEFVFPATSDPAGRYLFYLHGKIIEDQGIQAVSPEHGPYEYLKILETLAENDLTVISEHRPRDASVQDYAARVAEQVTTLLKAGIPASNITVVGASKGAWITILVSNQLENRNLNYVLLAICSHEVRQIFMDDDIVLSGRVLSIYDSVDPYAGSCQELFAFSEGRGLASHAEIVLEIGDGHGILYRPLDAWIKPVVQWATTHSEQ
jgi:hypothetical protein